MLKLKLEHVPNPDIPGGYHVEQNRGESLRYVSCETVIDASKKFRAWINLNDLGGGNLSATSGYIYLNEEDEKPYARISYNGNVWLVSDGSKIYDTQGGLSQTSCTPEGWVYA